jgi:hypothetical protein
MSSSYELTGFDIPVTGYGLLCFIRELKLEFVPINGKKV